jgi:carbon monoxide dehydrogenase subunit G
MSTDLSSEYMVTLSEAFVIPRPPAEVWPLLSDPKLVATCIPGAELDQQAAGGPYRGTIKVKFGPTVVSFRGEVDLDYDHESRRCIIRGRGIDQRGQSRANAGGVLRVEGSDSTKGFIEGGFSLTGPLETFARTGGVPIARALLAEFVRNMTALAEQGKGAAQSDSAAANASLPPASATLSASSIAWRALIGWLRGFFAR